MLFRNLKLVEASVIYGNFSEKKRPILPEKSLFEFFLKTEPEIRGGSEYRVRVQVLAHHPKKTVCCWECNNLT